MNTTVHPAEAINPQAAVSELKSAGASLRICPLCNLPADSDCAFANCKREWAEPAPISEFEQSMDDMLYAAYADGRADERDEIAKMIAERNTSLQERMKTVLVELFRAEWSSGGNRYVEAQNAALRLGEELAAAKATGAQQ